MDVELTQFGTAALFCIVFQMRSIVLYGDVSNERQPIGQIGLADLEIFLLRFSPSATILGGIGYRLRAGG
jgi:hypothetical protein